MSGYQFLVVTFSTGEPQDLSLTPSVLTLTQLGKYGWSSSKV